MNGDDPQIDWSGEAPRSARFGDIYFSPDDGLAESRAVFLDGCGLPDAWRGKPGIVVAELGFGTGLNIAALLDLWRRIRQPGQRLHVFSVEAWPVSRGDAARALAAFPEIQEASAALLDSWPSPAQGFHRVDLPWGATLDLAVMDATEAVANWAGRADAWFLDGFAPSANPRMWTPELLRLVAERSAPGARAATFTVAGAVRRALQDGGFEVHKKPGHGRKKQRLEAVLKRPAPPLSAGAWMGRVAIIGAGIAGASLLRALHVQSVDAVIVSPEDAGAGASGNPAALVSPRFDAAGGVAAQLYAQAFERARQLYAAAPEAVIARGALQLEAQARDAARFGKVTGSGLFAPGEIQRLGAADASRRLGEDTDSGGLWIEQALVVDPRTLIRTWLEQAVTVRASVAAIEPRPGGWRLRENNGAVLVDADFVCVCAGARAAALTNLPLTPVRGQVSWAEFDAPVSAAAWGGYALPTRDGVLFGATHDRGDTSTEVREEDHRRNLALLGRARPRLAERLAKAALRGRAGVRAATRDHLPVAGELAPGLFALGGLGGRGFTLAPLLAEHVAALITGAPSPLPRPLAAAVDPQRFAGGTRARGRRVAQPPA